MTASAHGSDWVVANQDYLSTALSIVKATLEARAKDARPDSEPHVLPGLETSRARLAELRESMAAAPALEVLASAFSLSPFERDLLLLAAGIELSSSFAALCAKAQGDPARSYATFSLALGALDAPHWSAVTAAGPLRRFRLVEVESGATLTTSPLRIDERVLCYLTGIDHIDERLQPYFHSVEASQALVPSHAEQAERIAELWSKRGVDPTWPAVQLVGDDPAEKRAIAREAAASLGLRLFVARAEHLPQAANDANTLLRLWMREAVLSRAALLLECDALDAAEMAKATGVSQFLERCKTPLFCSSKERNHIAERTVITIEVGRPDARERRLLFEAALEDRAEQLNGAVEAVASQFKLSTSAIRAASAACRAHTSSDSPPEATGRALWEACRCESRERLAGLAQRVIGGAEWDDLILPAASIELLKELQSHLRYRRRVYDEWGFSQKGQRGLGITALFSGASGTGKTMAAEVIARSLDLDLYRVDLSQAVSKYIGETEKNLKRIFDAAEGGGSVLLFDEADALFGRRSEVKDSHDRYANIEVSYLLQRMEEYSGLAILTTNFKDAIDAAFLRRIRFVVPFQFPDAVQREKIWQRVFPKETPLEGLDFQRLAKLNVAGGNIRNVAVFAAFLAADRAEPVRMSHLARAARVELQKSERVPTEAEIGGWL